MDEYRTANRANWDERVPVHAASAFYGLDRFVDDPAALSEVIRFDLPRLGDIAGLRGVHLQCHIGSDTISLARLGAQMTGLDFSGEAIAEARRLAVRAKADVEFVQADVYDAVEVLGAEQCDLVFTGIGALCWLPSVSRWASVVAALLRPGGRLFIRDCHPMMLAISSRPAGQLLVEYPYFETPDPIVFDDPTTYVEGDVRIEHSLTYSWNHGLGEIVSAVLDAGMTLTQLVEHETAPWEPLPGHTAREGHEWRLRERPERLPMTFTLQAVRP